MWKWGKNQRCWDWVGRGRRLLQDDAETIASLDSPDTRTNKERTQLSLLVVSLRTVSGPFERVWRNMEACARSVNNSETTLILQVIGWLSMKH